jgi:hypothetical protein
MYPEYKSILPSEDMLLSPSNKIRNMYKRMTGRHKITPILIEIFSLCSSHVIIIRCILFMCDRITGCRACSCVCVIRGAHLSAHICSRTNCMMWSLGWSINLPTSKEHQVSLSYSHENATVICPESVQPNPHFHIQFS